MAKLRRRIFDGEPATTIEADSIVIGLRNYSLRPGKLGKCVYERPAKTEVSPLWRNRNRADPDRAAAELLCPGAGENLIPLLPSDERPFSGLVVSTCLLERFVVPCECANSLRTARSSCRAPRSTKFIAWGLGFSD